MVHGVKELIFRCLAVGKIEAEVMSARMKGDLKYTSYPVDGCSGGPCGSFGLFRHFAYRHSSVTLTVDGRTGEKCVLYGIQMATPDSHW